MCRKSHRFLKVLYHLYVEQGIPLIDCLEIMSKKNDSSPLSKAALYIEGELRLGNRLSNAMKTCPYITFDSISVSFVDFSEKTGNLSETLTFLKERCERREKAASKVFEASLYPLFVIVLSLFVSGLMIFYADSVLGESFINTSLYKTLFCDLLFLFIFCFLMFFYLKNNLGDSPLYEAFLSVGFLIRYGVNASLAVGLGANILGQDSRAGQLFIKARFRMENGIDMTKAFCPERKNRGLLDKEILEAFYYAQKSGGKNDVFERIAAHLGKKNEKKTKLLLSLVEPAFTGGTGIFLIILMANFLMPVMNGLNLM